MAEQRVTAVALEVLNSGPAATSARVTTQVMEVLSRGGSAAVRASSMGLEILTPVAGAVAKYTSTWNPSDKTANFALKNYDLSGLATDGSNSGARGTLAYGGTDKVMLGFRDVTFSDGLDYIGVGAATATLGLADGTQNQVIIIQGGTVFSGNGSSTITADATFPAFSGDGNFVDLALDYANLRFWFRVNGGLWNNNGSADPATNTGGKVIASNTAKFPFIRMRNNGRATLDPNPLNIPSGFSAWEPAVPTSPAQPVIVMMQ
jgi:hypothetical protein